ncbi:MAG: response regulator transcription factor [Thermodesulfobacteriota bacterium]
MEIKHNKIMVVDDHTVIREALVALINSEEDLQVIGEAQDGKSAIKMAIDKKPDLILMDLSMPKMNGFDAIKEIRRLYPDTKIMALTVHTSEQFIHAALQAGANGYISKNASQFDLILALRKILKGMRYLGDDISAKVIDGYLEGRKYIKTQTTFETLSQREKEVLKLIAEGYKNKEIASYLCLSIKTIEKHRANLIRKLDLHNTAALTTYAIEQGLV